MTTILRLARRAKRTGLLLRLHAITGKALPASSQVSAGATHRQVKRPRRLQGIPHPIRCSKRSNRSRPTAVRGLTSAPRMPERIAACPAPTRRLPRLVVALTAPVRPCSRGCRARGDVDDTRTRSQPDGRGPRCYRRRARCRDDRGDSQPGPRSVATPARRSFAKVTGTWGTCSHSLRKRSLEFSFPFFRGFLNRIPRVSGKGVCE